MGDRVGPRRRARLIMAALLVAAGIVTATLWPRGLRPGPGSEPPPQPIAFSHRVHAGENQIPCLYCHVYARHGAVAGVPSVQRCMGCHTITAVASAEVQKLQGYWMRQEPIAWLRVFRQPDFVFFQHRPHVQAGIACQTCHGQVERMDRVREAVVLDMDRCVACHRAQQASIDCLTCHR